MTEISARYRQRSDTFAALIANVSGDQWSNPSPCEGWNARDVVRHVVDTQGLFLGLVQRELGPIPGVDSDPAAAWDAARAVVQADLDDPARAGREFDGFFGRTSFEQAVDRFLNSDLVIHGWDLARATGQTILIDAGDAERLLENAREFGDTFRGPQVCGPEVAVAADADAPTRLIAFYGRQP